MVGRGRIGAWARGEMKYRKTCVFQLSGGICFDKVVRLIFVLLI